MIEPADGESQGYTKNISLQKVHYNLSNKGKFLLVIIFFSFLIVLIPIFDKKGPIAEKPNNK